MQYSIIYYHFLELRLRFLYLLLSFNITFFLCYLNSFELIYFFVKPFACASNSQKKFIFTSLTEAFSSTLHICFFCSLFFLIPYFFYQVWCFLIPSCYIYERKKITLFAILFLLSFSIGCFFIYFFIIPKIYHFFITFEIKTILVNLELTARIQPYIVLTSWLFIALLFFFLAPFLFLILYKYKIINSRNLLNNRKFFIFFSIFAGAFFSPPDFFGQLALAIFFFFFLELIIWLSLFFDHNKVHNLI